MNSYREVLGSNQAGPFVWLINYSSTWKKYSGDSDSSEGSDIFSQGLPSHTTTKHQYNLDAGVQSDTESEEDDLYASLLKMEWLNLRFRMTGSEQNHSNI